MLKIPTAPLPPPVPVHLLTEREAAAWLRLSPSTLRTWRSLGRGPKFKKIGGSVRYLETDLVRFATK